MRRSVPALLLELWREQHPRGHEQTVMSFEKAVIFAVPVLLFAKADTTSLL
jgi:hypothetical protein